MASSIELALSELGTDDFIEKGLLLRFLHKAMRQELWTTEEFDATLHDIIRADGQVSVIAFMQWLRSGTDNPQSMLAEPTASPATKLRIVHVNDVYQLKNFSRLKTLIREQSVGCQNVFVTLAGDFIAPSLLSALDQGRGMIQLLNAVGVTHVCFGNHESDVPYEALKQRIGEFKGKWINSNMPDFEPKLPEFEVLELADEAGTPAARTVGLLGLLIGGVDRGHNFGANYREGALGGAASSIVAVMEAHSKAAQKLKMARPDVDAIIPLTHQDLKEDVELASCGEYAAVLAGHDHDLTITTHGPRATPVIKAGADAFNAVICDVLWPAGASTDAWPEVTTKVLAVKPYEKDPNIEKVVKHAEAPVRELETATLALLPSNLEVPSCQQASSSEVRLSSKHARYGPCSMAMYLAECMKICTSADAALVNSGAVRADAEYTHTFTYADLQKECPFPSECIVISLPGSILAEAVHKSRQGWLSPQQAAQPGRSPSEQSGALQHDLCCKCDEEHRLTHVANKPLDESKEYNVLVDTYDLAKDPVLSAFAKAHADSIPPADAGRPAMTVLVEYFCRQMWVMLAAGDDSDGQITREHVDKLFEECSLEHGHITLETLTVALGKKLGEGGSRLVAKQMMTLADRDEGGTVDQEELTELMIQMCKTMAWRQTRRGALFGPANHADILRQLGVA